MLLKIFFAIKSFNRHFDESVALLFRRRRKTSTSSSQKNVATWEFSKNDFEWNRKLYMIIIIIISLMIGWTYPWRVVTPLPWTGTISICVAGSLFFPNYTSAVSNGKKWIFDNCRWLWGEVGPSDAGVEYLVSLPLLLCCLDVQEAAF